MAKEIKTPKEVVDKFKEKAETAKKAVEEKAGTAKKVVEEKAETAKKVVEEKKAAAAEKKAAVAEGKKKTGKKAAVKETVYLQYGGKSVSQTELIKKVKENWSKVQKRKIRDIETISLYLIPESGWAYYVINGEGGDTYRVEL